MSKKGGTVEDIQARTKGETGIRDAETNMAVYGTNNQDPVESLWVKCESGALVWF